MIFETPGNISQGSMQAAYVPKPFVFDLPLQTKETILPGEYFSFGLTLVGQAIEYLPYFILAFEELGQSGGLGRGRGQFVLEEVKQLKPANSSKVYNTVSGQIMAPSEIDGQILTDEATGLWDTRANLKLELLTPGRFVKQGKLVDYVDFEILIRALLRRITWLGSYHCQVKLQLDFKEFIERAKRVPIIEHDTKWYDWERYSNRQRSKMTLGGLIGRIIYGEGWKDFLWLLALGEKLHIGKGATFGLGRYCVNKNCVS